MHSIFISYSSKHRELTRELAAAIEAQYGEGSVWWDHALESRASYSDQIKAALEEARVVVVIWTAGAMISNYVYAEAVTAQAQGKLVNVRPADISFRDIPEPFNIHHIDEAEDRQRILATIAKVMTGTPIPTRVPLHEIYYRQHGHRLIDPKQGKLPRDPHEVSPSDLLRARFEIVGYADATGTAAEFLNWCTGPRRTAARLIHGPGGAGKTRLMIDVAARLRERGWFAGFLDSPYEQVEATLKQRWQAVDQLIAHGEDEGLLIVLDYAEARQDEVRRIAERLGGSPEEGTRATRLVLLARSAGEWWSTLHDEAPELQRLFRSRAATADVISLPPIPAGGQRRALFDASLKAFGPWLAAQGYELPAGAPEPARLRRIETEATRPLAIQMEALLWLASVAPEGGAIGVDVLLDRVLGLERRHWSKLLGEVDAERTRDLARAVAQVTSMQGVPTSASAERLLMADEFYKGQRTARVAVAPVLRSIFRAYGRPDGGIDPLQPDLIGEHHVASAGDIELVTGCVRWIEEQPPQAQEKRRRDLLTVLQRATQPEHGAKANRQAATMLEQLVIVHLRAFASAMVAVMIDTPGALARCLDRRIDALDDDDLAAVDDALPLQSLLLMDLSLRIAQRRAVLARAQLAAMGSTDERKTAPCQSDLALRLNTLNIRLSSCGRRADALAPSRQAVDICRELAGKNRDAFRPDLAMSLNNLAVLLSELGDRQGALAPAREALEIRRELAGKNPDAFRPYLAGSLNNLANCLAALGDRQGALAPAREAVEIRRELAEKNPDAFHPDLASSLNNLGICLSELGDRQRALVPAREAAEIYRELAGKNRDAFRPDLAASLNNLAIRLSEVGDRQAALAPAREAVEIRRELAEKNPEAFRPDLAGSLSNLAKFLAELGDRQGALAPAREAVEIRRELAEKNPEAFRPALATSLNNLANHLSELGDRQRALAPAREAADIYRELTGKNRDAFRPDLAMSLNNLATFLSELDDRQGALSLAREAVEIRRELAEKNPEAFRPALANSLNNLAIHLSELGDRQRALAPAREAADIYRELAGKNRDAFRPDLAMSLNNLATFLSELGDRQGALAPAREAADIYRELVGKNPDGFRQDLAMSLNNLAIRLSELGDRQGALSLAREAVETLAPAFLSYPEAFGQWMATTARNYVERSQECNHVPNEALLGPIVAKFGEIQGDGRRG